ncbi:hypothetical protein AB0B45_22095 [Nonomuraea sp. NPDC049152]|uniref:hypothetical protein n=1 Tax=Nonomuraea sp. NPDC049152 TaxID=3154350 RepID=UPI0033C0673C
MGIHSRPASTPPTAFGFAGAAFRNGPSPRPYNKYLEWELARYPLPGWDTGMLLDAAHRISGTGDVSLQRRIFAHVEAAVRRAGHGAVLDPWGEDLDLMRPQ